MDVNDDTPRYDYAGRRWLWAAALTGLGFAMTVAALFPSYYEAGPSLASDPISLAFNSPFLAATALSTVFLAWPSSRALGLGLLIGSAVLSLPAYVRDVASHPGQRFGTGMLLGLAAFGLALAGAGVATSAAARCAMLGLAARRGAPLWSAVGAFLGGLYVLGDSMNWVHDRIHAGAAGYTFKLSGSATIVRDCCTLLHNKGWNLGTEVAIVTLAVIVPLLAGFWKVPAAGAGLAAGVGLILVASPLSEAVLVSQAKTPNDLGFPASQVTEGMITVEQSGLPGLWIALAAGITLCAVAAIRALLAAAERNR